MELEAGKTLIIKFLTLSEPQPDGTAHGAEALLDFTNLGGWLWLSHNEFAWLMRAPAPWNSIGNFAASTMSVAAGRLSSFESALMPL